MKIVLLIILLIPIFIFQAFVASDTIKIFMKTKKTKQKSNSNIVFLHDEKPPRKTSSRKTSFRVME